LIIFLVLKGRHVVVFLFVDGQAELDHAVDAVGELGGFVETEAGGEQGGVEHEPDQVAHGLVAGVLVGTLLEFDDDLVLGVEFERLLGLHVGAHGVVPECLSLHDLLHVGGPAVFAGHEHAWRVGDSVGYDDLLDLVTEHFLDEFAEPFVGGLLLLKGLLLVLGLLELEALLGAALELLALELLDLLDCVLVDRVGHEDDLVALALELLEEGAVEDSGLAVAGDLVDLLLVLLHARDLLLEGDHLVLALAGLLAHEADQFVAVLRVLVDAELEVLGELLLELHEVLLVLRDLREHLEAALDDVLLDDLEHLVLLEHLARDVEWQVVGVDDALDEAELLRDQFLAVVHDEDAAHLELDVVLLLLALEEVLRRALGGEEHRLELELALDAEVLDREVVLPVVGEALVEGALLLLGDVGGFALPDRLVLVDLLELVVHLLDLLGLLLLVLVLLLDLALLVLLLLVLLLLVLVVLVGDFLLLGLLDLEFDRELDELGVLADDVLELLLVELLELVVLEVQGDACPALEPTGLLSRGGSAGELLAGRTLPDVGLELVLLGHYRDAVRDQEGRVEAHAELPDQGHVCGALVLGLQELARARVGDDTQALDQVGLAHADSGVLDQQSVAGLVGRDADLELWLGLELLGTGDRELADLVQRV